jgi:hypothetical protein
LQNELETKIAERVTQTKQRLLESFDDEVSEKLRINKMQSEEFLGKFESWLWLLTKYYLKDNAQFDEVENKFVLVNNPFPNETIHPGPYRLGRHIEDSHVYRPSHPLALRIIEACKGMPTPVLELRFNYSDNNKKISILEPLVGRSGWLAFSSLTISSFEDEDHVLYSAVTDDGLPFDAEYIQRLFTLPAIKAEGSAVSLDGIQERLKQIAETQKARILDGILSRNSGFFDKEMEKLEKWAEDLKESMELEIKDLDRQIKAEKTEAKKILTLEDKVKSQREIKDMEKKRNSMRVNYFKEQDAIDARKEELIAQVESRLKQKIAEKDIFTIRWSLQ